MESIKECYAEKKRLEVLFDDIVYGDHDVMGFFETWELFNDCVSYLNNLGSDHVYCFKHGDTTVALNGEFIHEYSEEDYPAFENFIDSIKDMYTLHIDFEI